MCRTLGKRRRQIFVHQGNIVDLHIRTICVLYFFFLSEVLLLNRFGSPVDRIENYDKAVNMLNKTWNGYIRSCLIFMGGKCQ